ncbi:MAG: TolB family protein [Pirellulaceae bacterium]
MRRCVLEAAFFVVLPAMLPVCAVMPAGCGRVPEFAAAKMLSREPRVDPDYTDVVIPPNIAPLNFQILEDGLNYVVRISSDGGEQLEVHCRDGSCRIPVERWRPLLDSARGGRLHYDVFAQVEDGTWVQFEQVTNRVAEEPIDSYMVYRLLVPNKCRTTIRGIYQRDLESFRESALMTTRDGTFTCFNCHTFHQHDPNRFLVQLRNQRSAMMLVIDGKIQTIHTQQDPMFRPLAFASWHPGGRHIAATCNRFISHFPENDRLYYFQALEKRGDMVVYDVDNNTMNTTESVFGHEYVETHPCWSSDGKSIYYVRGKEISVTAPEDWAKSKFDMMRIAHDVATGTWGSPETVLACSEQGRSCAFPRPSPCGKYVLHIQSEKTTYPIHQESSDLYLLDLATMTDERLDAVCSDRAESYPRWSSNGRWFTFVSNRRDGMSAIPYLAYFDTAGRAHKAFILPQGNPAFYDTFMNTYNVVELVKSRVNVSAFRLAQGMRQPAVDAKFDHPPEVDAYTGPTRKAD